MLSISYVNPISFFQPISSTAAVVLTESLPPEQEANVLSLGCGDLRNVLFTCHSDPRPLDVTCCDREAVVIARNIVLLQVLWQVEDHPHMFTNWSLFYHFRIDAFMLRLVRRAARLLWTDAASLATWHGSVLGAAARFCDSQSLAAVRQVWAYWATERLGSDLVAFDARGEGIIKRARAIKRATVGTRTNMTGLRSAQPAQNVRYSDVSALAEMYWAHGCIGDTRMQVQAQHFNPLFVGPHDNLVLHYTTDPLLSYHLATAYFPLSKCSALTACHKCPVDGPRNQPHDPHECTPRSAYIEFIAWADAFRRRVKAGELKLRFFVGDAIALSFALQHRRACSDGDGGLGEPCHWYRDSVQFAPLVLDGEDYRDGGGAPLIFGVIDTSCLADHLGALNILVATSPLLQNDISSTIYTEMVHYRDDSKVFAKELLCGPLATVSLLLGLIQPEIVTNTSHASSSGELLSSCMTSGRPTTSHPKLVRLAWTRPVQLSGGPMAPPPALPALRVGVKSLVSILHHVYREMFVSEDIARLSHDNVLTQKLLMPIAHRLSFVAFVQLIKSRTTEIDFDAAMDELMDRIYDDRLRPMGSVFMPELDVWFHLLNVHTVESLRPDYLAKADLPSWSGLYGWPELPATVCITLVVPKERAAKIFALVEQKTDVLAAPMQCSLQTHPDVRDPWQSLFAVIHTGFGIITTTGKRNDGTLKVHVRDTPGWPNSGQWLMSFMIPAWMLFQSPLKSIEVGLTAMPTPITTNFLGPTLGADLEFFKAVLDNEDRVYISRHMPNLCESPIFTGFGTRLKEQKQKQQKQKQQKQKQQKATLVTAQVTVPDCRLSLVSVRVNVVGVAAQAALLESGSVCVDALTPASYEMWMVPNQEHRFVVDFPVPVLEAQITARVSRKHMRIEVDAPVARESDWTAFPSFMYPVYVQSGRVVAWNMPYLRLEILPAVVESSSVTADSMTVHLGLMFTARDKQLRDNKEAAARTGQRSRLEFRNSIFTILMQVTNTVDMGPSVRYFSVECAKAGGVVLLIIASRLRLDLAHLSVVLDAAVVPLGRELAEYLMPVWESLPETKRARLPARKAECTIWRRVLPALAERCRTWQHQPECEMLLDGQWPPQERGRDTRIFCSCGEGVFPRDFLEGVPQWQQLCHHAVRVAISPPWASRLVDEPVDADSILAGVEAMGFSTTSPKGLDANQAKLETVCRACGKSTAAEQKQLRLCGRCRQVKYCSRECQVSDWKVHKEHCSAAAATAAGSTAPAAVAAGAAHAAEAVAASVAT